MHVGDVIVATLADRSHDYAIVNEEAERILWPTARATPNSTSPLSPRVWASTPLARRHPPMLRLLSLTCGER